MRRLFKQNLTNQHEKNIYFFIKTIEIILHCVNMYTETRNEERVLDV